MKLSKKLFLSLLGVGSLAVAVPVVLTSCSQGTEQNSSTGTDQTPGEDNNNSGSDNNNGGNTGEDNNNGSDNNNGGNTGGDNNNGGNTGGDNNNGGNTGTETKSVILFSGLEGAETSANVKEFSLANGNFFFFGRVANGSENALFGLNDRQLQNYFGVNYGQKLNNKVNFASLMAQSLDLNNYNFDGSAITVNNVDYIAQNNEFDVTLAGSIDGSNGKFVVFGVSPKADYKWGNVKNEADANKTVYLAIQLF